MISLADTKVLMRDRIDSWRYMQVQDSEPYLREFQKLCGDLDYICDFERARDYFDSLEPKIQKTLRRYRAVKQDSEVDFFNLYNFIANLNPTGMAQQVGKLMLKNWALRQRELAVGKALAKP